MSEEQVAPPGGRYDGFWKALSDQVRKNEETIEALRRSEQKFRSIFEHAVVGVFQTTPDGHYLSANPALARLYGYGSPEELMAAMTDIGGQLYVQPGRREEFVRLMREDGSIADFESEVFRRDGARIWISESARAVRDEVSSELLYYEGMVLDITRRIEAEAARREAAARKAAQYAVTRALAEAMRIEEAAGKVLRAIGECVGWDLGTFWSVSGGALECIAIWHAPEQAFGDYALATRELAFTPGVGLPGRVLASRKPEWVMDAAQDVRMRRAASAARVGLHAAFAFPVLLGEEVIAVMEFLSREVREPDDDLLSMMGALATQIGQFIERARIAQELTRTAEALRKKNEQFKADLEMARDVQQVFITQRYPILPRGAAPEESWLRFHHHYLPAETVSGDFFSVLPVSATEAGVFICDVVGHGLRAALVTAIVRGLVEELTPHAADPSRFLVGLNRGLLAIFRQTDTPMLASAFYLVVDLATGQARYANAGHPSPLHVRRDAGVVDRFPRDATWGPVLGVFENVAYRTGTCPLAPNDLMVLFTDGLYEVEIEREEFFGEQRLLAAVQERMALPARQLFPEVIEQIQRVSGRQTFLDDVCMVGVEVLRLGAPEGETGQEFLA
jgi:PAS domain S-box-containing protein